MADLTPGQAAIATALKALVQMARDNNVPVPQEVRDFAAATVASAPAPPAESTAVVVSDVIPAPMNATTVSTSGFGAPEVETKVVAPATNLNVTSTVAPATNTNATTTVAPATNLNVTSTVAPATNTNATTTVAPASNLNVTSTVAPMANANVVPNAAPVVETTIVQQAVPAPPAEVETTVVAVPPTVDAVAPTVTPTVGGRRRTKKNRKYRSSPRRR